MLATAILIGSWQQQALYIPSLDTHSHHTAAGLCARRIGTAAWLPLRLRHPAQTAPALPHSYFSIDTTQETTCHPDGLRYSDCTANNDAHDYIGDLDMYQHVTHD